MVEIISADSVELLIDSIAATRKAAEVTLFGEESVLCTDVVHANSSLVGSVESMVANPMYTTLAIAFLLLYLVWLPHIIKNGKLRWGLLMRLQPNGDRELMGHQRLGIIVATWGLVITLFSMFAARIVAQLSPLDISFDGSWWIVGGVVSMLCITLYGWLVLKGVGYLIIDMTFVNKLLSAKRQLLFCGIIFLSPLFITSSLSNYNQGEFVIQISMLVGVILILNFMRQSFLLFMQQNFSILHWFLYLCGVEILPLTFIWAITTRYLGA